MESAQFSGHSITSNPSLLNSVLHQPAKLGINPYSSAMINNTSFCYVRVVWEQTLTRDGFVVGGFFSSFLLNSHILPIISSSLFKIIVNCWDLNFLPPLLSILTFFFFSFILFFPGRKLNKLLHPKINKMCEQPWE